MSDLMFNNSTSAYPLRVEFNEYVGRVNHILIYFQVFICIFGLVGNLLALIVINQKSLRNTSSAVFITYMAIFDSAVLIFHAINLAKLPRYIWLHCALTFCTDLSIFCANWILVIITLERCVAVYSPFLAKRFCTIHSARCSMYSLLTISVVFFSSTFFFFYQIQGASIHQKCRIKKSAGSLIRIYQPILFVLIPDVLLLSNLFTVYSLCRRRQRLSVCYHQEGQHLEMRVSDVHFNRKQRQLTIMLVTVSLSFYLFTTPAMVSFIAEMNPLKEKQLIPMKRMFLFGQISVVISELNNATNFLFYCFTGQRFRLVTRQTLYYYSREFKRFYYRYILCDKHYQQMPFYQHKINSSGHTVLTNRGSSSAYYPRQQFRTSLT